MVEQVFYSGLASPLHYKHTIQKLGLKIMFLVNTLEKSSTVLKIGGKKIQFIFDKPVEVLDKQVSIYDLKLFAKKNVYKVEASQEFLDSIVEKEILFEEQVPEAIDFQPSEDSQELTDVEEVVDLQAQEDAVISSEALAIKKEIDDEAKKMNKKKKNNKRK